MKNTYKIVSAVLVLACLLSPGVVTASTRMAKLVCIDGIVEFQKPGGEWAQADLDMELNKDYMLRTGDGSTARIELDDGSLVALGEATILSIVALDKSDGSSQNVSVFKLMFGEIKAKVMKLLGDEARFEVQTSVCIAGVRGTEFVVTNEAGEASDVEVLSGSVAVDNVVPQGKSGVRRQIAAGFVTRVEKDKAPIAAEKIASHSRARWQLVEYKDGIFKKTRELENTKKGLEKLRVAYSAAKTPEGRKLIIKQKANLKKKVIILSKEIDRDKKVLLTNKAKFDNEAKKAVEKWNKLTPEQKKKTHMDYETWKRTSPKIKQLRRERMRKKTVKWNKLPPQVRKRIVLSHKLWKKLPPAQKRIVLEKARQFRNLPPWKKKNIMQNYRKWKKLPPAHRKIVTTRYKMWRALPHEARENWKDGMEKYKRLPAKKRKGKRVVAPKFTGPGPGGRK